MSEFTGRIKSPARCEFPPPKSSTVEGYLAELEKRQRLELSYRERAEQKLEELLKEPKAAYAYWLKANAQLQAMGIYPLALPDALRSYQMGLDIEE